MKFAVAILFVTCVVLFNFVELNSAEGDEGYGGAPGRQGPGFVRRTHEKLKENRIYHTAHQFVRNPVNEAKRGYYKVKGRFSSKRYEVCRNCPANCPECARAAANNNNNNNAGPSTGAIVPVSGSPGNGYA